MATTLPGTGTSSSDELADAIRRWKILTVIGRLLEIVRKRYETDRQPETLREASQYLVRLTDGHYTRVWMPLDRRGLLVENDKGESLSLDVLSRGTREAVFIGLRLALVDSFARRGAMLPLVLDDVLVNFDTDRVRCAAEVLCDFARTGHQVIMFTCHEHITDIFEDAQADVRVLPHRGDEVDPRPVKRRRNRGAGRRTAAASRRRRCCLSPSRSASRRSIPTRSSCRPPTKSSASRTCRIACQGAAAAARASSRRSPSRESRYKIVPRDWDRDHWPLAAAPVVPVPQIVKPAPVVDLDLPDAWPLVEVPEFVPRTMARTLEPFEVLAYRSCRRPGRLSSRR